MGSLWPLVGSLCLADDLEIVYKMLANVWFDIEDALRLAAQMSIASLILVVQLQQVAQRIIARGSVDTRGIQKANDAFVGELHLLRGLNGRRFE